MQFIKDLSVTSSLKEVLVEILVKGLSAPHKLKSQCAIYIILYTLYVTYYNIFS